MNHLKKVVAVLLSIILVSTTFPQIQGEAVALEPMLQIKLRNYLGNKNTVVIVPSVEYSTNLANIKLAADVPYTLKLNNGNIVILKGTSEIGRTSTINVSPTKGTGTLKIEKRPYLGSFSFIVEDNKYIRPINTIGLENYLKGVVPAEMPALWPLEALKAQTLSARTYATGYLGTTINDTQSFQVYGGYDWHERATKAVDDTYGQVIAYEGNSIGSAALFSSSNGGKTESNTNAWGTPSLPYLTIKSDPYDPKTIWSLSFKKTQIDIKDLDFTKADFWWNNITEAEQTAVIKSIQNWLIENGFKDKDFKIAAIPYLSLREETSGGRVSKGSITIEILIKDGPAASLRKIELVDTTAAKIRTIIGLNHMKSYLISSIEDTKDMIKVTGAGYGHGVGLSQYGAKKAAELGKSYKDILAFYYDKTTIATLYQKPTIPKTTPVKDTNAPVIKNIKTSYYKKKKQVKVSYSINEKAKVTLFVKDRNGKIIATPVKNKEQKAGSYTAYWKVSKVKNGKYSFIIAAEDASKNQKTVTKSYTLKKTETGKVKATTLNIRANASTKSKVVGTVKKDKNVTILDQKGSWYKIKYGKTTGYVAAKYISKVK